METIFIVVLGAIQGATEFLPVSSSGHLALGQMVASDALGRSLSNQPLMLGVLLHLATLLAVILFYRREVRDALVGAFRAVGALPGGRFGEVIAADDGANMALCVLVGTLPTGILGLGIRDFAEGLSVSPVGLGICFVGCSVMLMASRWWPGGERRLDWRVALLIGLVQGVAVLPGISRSGMTIALGLALGLRPAEAVRFSFLLSIPAILGAALLEIDPAAVIGEKNLGAVLFGGAAAFVVGLVALVLLERLVLRGRFWVFAPYVGIIGLVSILFVR